MPPVGYSGRSVQRPGNQLFFQDSESFVERIDKQVGQPVGIVFLQEQGDGCVLRVAATDASATPAYSIVFDLSLSFGGRLHAGERKSYAGALAPGLNDRCGQPRERKIERQKAR